MNISPSVPPNATSPNGEMSLCEMNNILYYVTGNSGEDQHVWEEFKRGNGVMYPLVEIPDVSLTTANDAYPTGIYRNEFKSKREPSIFWRLFTDRSEQEVECFDQEVLKDILEQQQIHQSEEEEEEEEVKAIDSPTSFNPFRGEINRESSSISMESRKTKTIRKRPIVTGNTRSQLENHKFDFTDEIGISNRSVSCNEYTDSNVRDELVDKFSSTRTMNGKHKISTKRQSQSDTQSNFPWSWFNYAFSIMFQMMCFIPMRMKSPGKNSLYLKQRSLYVNAACPARAMAWHHCKQLIAFALKNDLIIFYDLIADQFHSRELSIPFQQRVFQLEWKPVSGYILAVACRNGVCIWDLNTDLANLLSFPGCAPVTSIAWSPNGRLIASGSPLSKELIVWNISDNFPTVLSKSSVMSSGTTFLKWSPSGHYLFQATTTGSFRVWETRNWTCQTWSNLSSYCQSACWSPNGQILIVAVFGESCFYSFGFWKEPPEIDGQFLRCDNTEQYNISFPNGQTESVGGAIKEMQWDPTGERLVISFLGNQSGSNLMALYTTSISEELHIIPRGFIRGPIDGYKGEIFSFKPNFDRGALLTTCWLNGWISFVPLYFNPKKMK